MIKTGRSGCQAKYGISTLSAGIVFASDLSGRRIGFVNLNLGKSYNELVELIATIRPDAIVHFAEQRSAPFSMKSPSEKRYTISNNVNATHDLVCALAECAWSRHVVHLGSMGVYGYKSTGFARPEGYLPILTRTGNGNKVQCELGEQSRRRRAGGTRVSKKRRRLRCVSGSPL